MEGDLCSCTYSFIARNFNPLPPHGGRPAFPFLERSQVSFQSTPSAWRETPDSVSCPQFLSISIHSLRMEGDDLNGRPLPPQSTISIHSLRMEGDGNNHLQSILPVHFNPLPPHGGRQDRGQNKIYRNMIFQSTPSAWRETQKTSRHPARESHFNPLPPHGGRRFG